MLLRKKKLRKSILSLWPFFPILVRGDTVTSDKHKGGRGEGGRSAITSIITQFYFYFAHLKST